MARSKQNVTPASRRRPRAGEPRELTARALRDLMDGNPLLIVGLDGAGRVAYANPAFFQTTGYTRAQVLGQSWWDCFISPHEQNAFRTFAEFRPQHQSTLLTKAGGERLIAWQNSLRQNARGQITGMLSVGQDVRAQKTLEDQLRAERDRRDAILGSIAEGVLVADANDRLILVNRAAEKLIGLPRAELLGRDFDTVALPVTRADLAQSRALTTGEPPTPPRVVHAGADATPPEGIRRNVRAWGPRLLDLAITPLYDGRGQLAGTVSLLREVTEIVRVDQLKSEFISLVSHEMRAPLTSIKGYTDLILGGDAGPVNDEQQEYLRVAQANVERLIMMINDLLDLSQIEAGRIKLVSAPVALAPLVGEIVRALRPQWQAKAQRVQVELPKPDPLILADRDRLAQILWNLLSNANKYSPSGTRTRIAGQLLEAGPHTAVDAALISHAAPLLALSVEDEGIGVAPEDQPRLFTKFFRADNAVVRAAGGTGLGLAIVKSFVELHGGKVWVESPVDAARQRGTRITFTVPLATGASSPPTNE